MKAASQSAANAMRGLTTHRPLREELPMAVEQSTKFCKKCRTEHPVSMFNKCSRNKDGMHSYCKPCRAKIASEHYYANADSERLKSRESARKHRAANPDKCKLYYAENRDKELERGRKYRAKSRDKRREYAKKHYAANREKILSYGKEWAKNNPEKARARVLNRIARRLSVGGKLSSDISTRLFKLQRGKCACCGKSLVDGYHIDHIMPLALGGPNTDDNIQLLCATCNLSKGAKHPVDFMRQRGFLI